MVIFLLWIAVICDVQKTGYLLNENKLYLLSVFLDHSLLSELVSIIIAHVQKSFSGLCDLILNKQVLGNGRAWQQVVEKVDSVIRQSYPVL